MIDGEYILQSGKFSGCRLSDIPRRELTFWALRGLLYPTDRCAIREYVWGRRSAVVEA